jgi:hypothetical protein
MTRSLLIRGMLAGLVAGLLAAGFAALIGETQVSHAISFEAQLRQLSGQPADPVLVSRSVQSSIGMLTGMTIYGVAFGGIFAIVFALAYGRLGAIRARATAALLAGGGLLGIYLVPGLKYPANPPSIGHPDTIGRRTELYVDMLLLSVVILVGAVLLGRYLLSHRRFRGWDAALLGGLAYITATTVVMITLPSVNEVPATFPATVLWHFRIASAGIQLVLWTSLALLFGVLAERVLETRPAKAHEPDHHPSEIPTEHAIN